MKLEWSLYDKYWWSWKLLAFGVSSVIPLLSWGIINANILRPLSDHSSMHSSWKESCPVWSADSSWEFTLWQTVELPVIWDAVTFMWRHCNEICLLSLYHPYEITFEIRMSSVWLNQIIHISLQWRYMGTITSHITGDTTVCSCASAAWQQRKSQSSTYCQFLGVSPDDWVILSTKGRWCGKRFHVMASLCHTDDLLTPPYDIGILLLCHTGELLSRP